MRPQYKNIHIWHKEETKKKLYYSDSDFISLDGSSVTAGNIRSILIPDCDFCTFQSLIYNSCQDNNRFVVRLETFWALSIILFVFRLKKKQGDGYC